MGRWRGRARDPLAGCAQVCADYLAQLDAGSRPGGPAGTSDNAADAALLRLAGALGTLLAAPGFDALLRAGDAALRADGAREAELALRLADLALADRRKSKGGWRLRARALETLERPVEAAEAYESYLALADGAAAGEAALRLATLRERLACLTEAAGLFGPDGPDGPDGCPHADAFAAAVRDAHPAAATEAAFTAHLSVRLRQRGAADPEVRRLATLYATYRRLNRQPRIADPLLDGTEPCGVAELRRLVAGRRVCVVAGGAPPGADGALAATVDAYDLVVRCDDYRTDGPGARTDVHAVSAVAQGRTARWHEPVRARLVFADSGDSWQRAQRQLVPGAQRYAGDIALRRPLADPALIGESDWGARPTTGFTVLRLLDFLDVSAAIDLIGHGPPGRLREPERAWVTAHATHTTADGVRTSLR